MASTCFQKAHNPQMLCVLQAFLGLGRLQRWRRSMRIAPHAQTSSCPRANGLTSSMRIDGFKGQASKQCTARCRRCQPPGMCLVLLFASCCFGFVGNHEQCVLVHLFCTIFSRYKPPAAAKVFVRSGAIIPMWPLLNFFGEKRVHASREAKECQPFVFAT